MYTRELVRLAKKGERYFELFMELHRRATERQLKKKKIYDWDGRDADSRYTGDDADFIKDYDWKWGVVRKNGCSYMYP
jgi:hypothetical protein